MPPRLTLCLSLALLAAVRTPAQMIPGLELWSLRDEYRRDPAAALDRAKAFGFTEVETADLGVLSAADLDKLLRARGLTAVSAHFSYPHLQQNLAGVIRDAQALGVHYVICPAARPDHGSFDAAFAHRLAAQFNAWGRSFRQAGIQFGYHAHGIEFGPVRPGSDQTAFDVLVRETDPDLVCYEMDVFWVVHAGQDPNRLLDRYPGRWRLFHLKDLRRGAATGALDGKAPIEDFVAIGDGQIGWPVLLPRARAAGVTHFFIEDESADPVRNIAASLRYLESAAIPPGSTAESKKRLLLDASVRASSSNLAVEIGPVRKFAGNPLFGEEYPWEPRFDNMYPNAIWDAEERVYKCWYNLFVIFRPDARTATRQVLTWTFRESGLAYATSVDGIHWHKPLLGDFPFDGRPSNVLMRDAHGVGVFKDARETDPGRRYKAIFRREEHGEARGFACAFSPDGIHWSRPVDIPNIRLKADTHNNALWAPTLGKYVGFTRDWGPAVGRIELKVASAVANSRDRVRLVARTESRDFIHWADARVVFRGLDDDHQVYAMPVFYDAGIYLGFPVILDIRADRAHTELAWSPDTIHWERVSPGHPLIGNAEEPGAYDWGCAYASPPVLGEKEIRIYYGASDNTHTGPRHTHLALATLRPDGFAGAEPADPARSAEILTVPLAPADAATLALTADVSSGGSIEAEILDAAGGRLLGRIQPVEGPREITGLRVGWGAGAGAVPPLVRIRFRLRRARLYSFEI